ncbi:hypothetical protein [Gracilibacillus xinjiangensis]|uniref:Uncharacterized protein n=1 Tax=Gracilibacillus xinjiangensis TaxID=1193282 RepID=A0ABV8X0Q1_9BACI
MKKYIFFILSVFVFTLTACGAEEETKTEGQGQDQAESDSALDEEAPQPERPEEEKAKEATDSIDTSMYEYASNVEVTDAIEINNHITLMIDMNDNLEQGLAFMHATNQTYDFIEQNNMVNVETIGINIRLKGIKIAMFTVHPGEIEKNETESMANIVLKSSEVEMVSPEVEEFIREFDLSIK